ncbi:MAG: hypothetical protein IPN53_02725 [Comamonadaceae bacterium]|nr:hypothetical protein [Comamonadaceae bacterium]
MCIALGTSLAQGAELPAALQAKVTKYQKQLVEWAANPLMISATKEANAKGGFLPGMTNAKWNDLDDKDPAVLSTLNSPAGLQIRKWEEDKNLNKLFLRDQKANVIAGSSKTLLFNNASRPASSNALKGQAWADTEIKPDPTTQIKSVQVSAPVLDGGKTIGILHGSVTAE